MSVAPAVTAYGLKWLAAKSIHRQGAALMEAYTCACMKVSQGRTGPHAILETAYLLQVQVLQQAAPAGAWLNTGPARSMPLSVPRIAAHFHEFTQGSHLVAGSGLLEFARRLTRQSLAGFLW